MSLPPALTSVGLLILRVAFGTRFAAIPLAITMMVTMFVVHASEPWKVKELAAVYLSVYVSLALTAAGRFSLDYTLTKHQPTLNKEDAVPAR